MSTVLSNVFDAITLLKPYDIDIPKAYFGKPRDGGYVLADRISQSDVLSFGAGSEISFERSMAHCGRRVFINDHTVDCLPEDHDLFYFEKRGISAEGILTEDLAPLSYHIQKLAGDSCILKMDVEGAEWDVFSTISHQDLKHFDQIVFEGHWLERLGEPEYCEKVRKSLSVLSSEFTLFHVHANNHSGLYFVEGLAVASVLELSYIRTALIQRYPSKTFYPCVNKSNYPYAQDHPLLFYPFLPNTDTLAAAEMVRLVAAEDAEAQLRRRAGEPVSF